MMSLRLPKSVLEDEYSKILAALDDLIRECEAIEQGKNTDDRFLLKTIDFISRRHKGQDEFLFFGFLTGVESFMEAGSKRFVLEIKLALKKKNGEKLVDSVKNYTYSVQMEIFKVASCELRG